MEEDKELLKSYKKKFEEKLAVTSRISCSNNNLGVELITGIVLNSKGMETTLIKEKFGKGWVLVYNR